MKCQFIIQNSPFEGGRGMFNSPFEGGRGMSNSPLEGGRGMYNSPLEGGRGMSNSPLEGGRGMLFLFVVCIIALILPSCSKEKESPDNRVFGLQRLSYDHFPIPEGAVDFDFPNGNLKEIKNHWPVGGWMVPDGNKIAKTVAALVDYNQTIPKPAEIAYAMKMTLGEYDFICSRLKTAQIASPWADPSQHTQQLTFVETNATWDSIPYLHFQAGQHGLLRSPDFKVKAGKPHFLSLWVRSDWNGGHSPEFIFWYDVGLEEIAISFYSLPETKGEWKRYGFYFRALSDTESAHFTLHFPGHEDAYIDMTGFQLRSATEQEFSAAYAEWRKTMPDHLIKKTPDDGKYLATAIAKLEGKLGLPGRPFVIWGVGSSWTNGLDDLEPVRQAILSRFPEAPEIIYRKIVGSGSPYDYIRGWVHTKVLSDQPDLIISYTNGSVEALELMLKDIRNNSTADIIIPSLHFFENENDRLTPEVINQPIFDQIRDVCVKYNAQFVDNRRAIAQWLLANNKQVKDLLSDGVHQNNLGRLLTCENIGQQFVRHPAMDYDLGKLEEKITLSTLFPHRDSLVVFSEGWSIVDNRLTAKKAGSSIKFTFTGNRIDLIGQRKADGGSVAVFVDGQPAKEAPVFVLSYINPAITNICHMGFYPRWSKGVGDTGPHGVWLGGGTIVPQKWTIRMLDNEGHYALEGSITKKDGTGNNTMLFNGQSGQIIVDPALWRHPSANVKGDYWTFNVTRSAIDTVKFSATDSNPVGLFSSRLVWNLKNDFHTIELKTSDDNEVTIESLYVFRPKKWN